MSSFTQYLESKKNPTVTISLEQYKVVAEQEIYDNLLNDHKQFIASFLEAIINLPSVLQAISYPKNDDLLLAVASREPSKIKLAHEQLVTWAKTQRVSIADVENSLFEARSYLYGKELKFSKEVANRICEAVLSQTLKNAKYIANLLETGMKTNPWNNSTVILKILPTKELISNEAMIIVGYPPATMTFVCKKNPTHLEVYDIHDIEGYPLTTQRDYVTLIETLHRAKLATFPVKYAAISPQKRPLFESLKRDLALGLEVVLPENIILSEEMPDSDLDIWQIKFKNKITEEIPIRWLNLIKKAVHEK